MSLKRRETIQWLIERPVEFVHKLGFTKLTELHNGWIQEMVIAEEDQTLQGHRGSYKTTCLSVALAIIIIIFPYKKTLFMRKTDTDTQEIVAQVKKILRHEFTQGIIKRIYDKEMELTTERVDAINTSFAAYDPRGTPQLLAMGIGASITGKHFDFIFTDDIVNKDDRKSKAERERTKTAYYELQNIKNRGGRIFNTGTPWHEDDAFSVMPPAKKYDCYSTGLISTEELKRLRESMTASLFAANYELRHIASDDVIFTDPTTGADPELAEQGYCHVDAAYGGEDYTAFTICAKRNGFYYVYGRLWQKHIDDVEEEIIKCRKSFNAGRISCEDNGDKGYLGKDLRKRGERTHIYHESMNKYLKITTYLKGAWKNVVFVAGTDAEYIRQICDFTEDAEHDDAPDSLASLIRELANKKDTGTHTTRTSYMI